MMLAVAVCSACPALAAEDGVTVAAASKPGRAWRSYKTRTLAHLKGFKPAPDVPLCKYGGLASTKLKATGFFRTEKVRGHWLLVDPDGHPFISKALNSVHPDLRYNRDSFARAFAGEARWAGQTAQLMRKTGFNTLGCWSQWEAFRKLESPWPYTRRWNFIGAYRRVRRRKYSSGDEAIFILDPQFEAFCTTHARQLAPTKDDPYLLGHFSDNEMPLRTRTLDMYLKLAANDPSRQAAQKWLRGRGRDAGRFGDADREAFLEHVVAKYFRTVSRAIRKVDPNHLYLGTRFHGGAKYTRAVHKGCGPYVDVVSINYYSRWTPERRRMDQWLAWTGKPFLITEWYVKGVDSGLTNSSGAGWLVKTQADRGRFYQHFALGLIAHPGCVGMHWHRYLDNSSQRQGGTSNKGLVDLNYKPYGPLRDAMGQFNTQIYPLLWAAMRRQGSD